MTHQELSALIIDRFVPLAFSCDCNGTHADCAEVLSDQALWAQRATAMRIARFIESLDS